MKSTAVKHFHAQSDRIGAMEFVIAFRLIILLALGITAAWIGSFIRRWFSLLELFAFVSWVAVLCAAFRCLWFWGLSVPSD